MNSPLTSTAPHPGTQSVYNRSGEEVFFGQWDPRALLTVLGDRTFWSGLKVLDIGANTAGLSVEIARCGADVVALEPDPYSNSASLSREAVERVTRDEGLRLSLVRGGLFDADTLGGFDAVLCLGLVYHFRDPQYVLDFLSTIEHRHLFVSTQTHPGRGLQMMNRVDSSVMPASFFPADAILSGWHPTHDLFERMLRSAGFDQVVNLTSRVDFPKKPIKGLTNSAYYRATRHHAVDPVASRRTYLPR